MIIESVVAGVIANFIYESTKRGISLSREYLVRDLAKIVTTDQKKIEDIADELVELDKRVALEDLSENGIVKQMQKSPQLVKTINSVKIENINQPTQYHYGSGDNVGGNKIC